MRGWGTPGDLGSELYDCTTESGPKLRSEVSSVVDVTAYATFTDTFGTGAIAISLEDWVTGLRVNACCKIGMVEPSSMHKWMSAGRRYIARHLFKAMLRFVGVLIGKRGVSAEPSVGR